ncbi:unnamed protein product, partial [Discosporangium mesarthrocarpum]
SPRLLILGGTGFIGSTIAKFAVKSGFEVTSISRRGAPSPTTDPDTFPAHGISWLQGDVTDPEVVQRVIQQGPYVGVVHAVGMLFAGSMNRFASGSRSVPNPGCDYDTITRQTAFSAAEAFAEQATEGQPLPFVFISAAEARWDFDDVFHGTPLRWLNDYLIAKRAVEDEV